jgi:hypothetical protein
MYYKINFFPYIFHKVRRKSFKFFYYKSGAKVGN